MFGKEKTIKKGSKGRVRRFKGKPKTRKRRKLREHRFGNRRTHAKATNERRKKEKTRGHGGEKKKGGEYNEEEHDSPLVKKTNAKLRAR